MPYNETEHHLFKRKNGLSGDFIITVVSDLITEVNIHRFIQQSAQATNSGIRTCDRLSNHHHGSSYRHYGCILDRHLEEQKKKAAARKKQKIVELKEIKLRPNIDTHDYDVKAKSMHRFFEEGDKVKVTLRFRGREMAHPELGMKLLNKVQADFDEVAKVEYAPRMEGRQMIMILAPR